MSYADMPTWAVDTLPSQRAPFNILTFHMSHQAVPMMSSSKEMRMASKISDTNIAHTNNRAEASKVQ